MSADEAVRAEAWDVIAKIRDASPRRPNDASTDDIVDALAAAGLLAASTASGTDEAGGMLTRYYDLMEEMAGDDQVLRERVAAGRARLAARSEDDGLRRLAEWLVSLDDDTPESPGRQARRTVTLTIIIERARRALAPVAKRAEQDEGTAGQRPGHDHQASETPAPTNPGDPR